MPATPEMARPPGQQGRLTSSPGWQARKMLNQAPGLMQAAKTAELAQKAPRRQESMKRQPMQPGPVGQTKRKAGPPPARQGCRKRKGRLLWQRPPAGPRRHPRQLARCFAGELGRPTPIRHHPRRNRQAQPRGLEQAQAQLAAQTQGQARLQLRVRARLRTQAQAGRSARLPGCCRIRCRTGNRLASCNRIGCRQRSFPVHVGPLQTCRSLLLLFHRLCSATAGPCAAMQRP